MCFLAAYFVGLGVYYAKYRPNLRPAHIIICEK